MITTREILTAAKAAKASLSSAGDEVRRRVLRLAADYMMSDKDLILSENEKDVEAAKGSVSDVMLDRLRFTAQRLSDSADAVRHVAELQSPVGRVTERTVREDGLVIEKVSVPIGVVGMIYESRPNVTADAAALSIMSGNVAVLRAGKEAYRTSLAIVLSFKKALTECGIDENAVSLLDSSTRESAEELMRARGYIDILIPRGGAGLIRACVENAEVPCIETGTGICHIYVDKDADMKKALDIIENAKTSRPSVCNAAEVCLVDSEIAETFLPMLYKRLCTDRADAGKIPVELRLSEDSSKIIDGKSAGENDFDTEFLDYILAVKTVDGVAGAVRHIAAHSTGHSEAIVTENTEAAEYFTSFVDSAAVYVNASTRFTDGGEFGLGCEIGISTQKLHARGPMGLSALTTYKYIVRGNGHIR